MIQKRILEIAALKIVHLVITIHLEIIILGIEKTSGNSSSGNSNSANKIMKNNYYNKQSFLFTFLLTG